ncbi:hypothetical protein D7Y23_10405, partial [Corallococcus sp. AB050B]
MNGSTRPASKGLCPRAGHPADRAGCPRGSAAIRSGDCLLSSIGNDGLAPHGGGCVGGWVGGAPG